MGKLRSATHTFTDQHNGQQKKKNYAYALAKIRTCVHKFITLKEGFQLWFLHY